MAWKMAQSPLCKALFVSPGNAGTSAVATNVPLDLGNHEALGQWVLEQHIDMVVVGPEAPLVAGLQDYFASTPALQKVLFVGPGKKGAMLEGSKDFSKQFMLRHGIPTAGAKTFTAQTLDQGLAYIETLTPPIVLKADGLAAGKGVLILPNKAEAAEKLRQMLVGEMFGQASSKVVIEDFLQGIELSVFVLTDGQDYVILPEAKDYKRIGEQDTGPNTGGMGAVSPVPFAQQGFMQKVEEQVVKPTLKGLQQEQIPFKGFLFIGLMNVQGQPYVIEYNVRMGDPETQAVMPRIKSDLVVLLEAAAKGQLGAHTIDIAHETVATVVLVAGGYPGSYEKGKVIEGLSHEAPAQVFHAGTKTAPGTPQVLTNGGRVLAISAKGATLEQALDQAYQQAGQIHWPNMYYRKDIGQDLLNP